MGWKIFAAISVLFLGVGLLDGQSSRDAVDLLSIPIEAIAVIGLFAYAFGLVKLHMRYWTAFAWIFAAWSLLGLVVMAFRASSAGSPTWAIAGGGLIAAAMFYFQWVALHRLGSGEQA